MFRSSLEKKYWMAVTGLILLGFVVAHLLGNLQVFLGADWLNDYSQHLLEWPLLLWPARAILLSALLLHMILGIQLGIENRQARPKSYIKDAAVQLPAATRTMLFTGLAVFFFIVYHLLHLTWGTVHPQFAHLTDAQGRHDVYSTVILSFREWPIAGTYLLAVALLSFHLSHGAGTFLQSLGLLPEGSHRKMRKFGVAFGWFIFLGYTSIPVCSFFGILQPLKGGA